MWSINIPEKQISSGTKRMIAVRDASVMMIESLRSTMVDVSYKLGFARILLSAAFSPWLNNVLAAGRRALHHSSADQETSLQGLYSAKEP